MGTSLTLAEYSERYLRPAAIDEFGELFVRAYEMALDMGFDCEQAYRAAVLAEKHFSDG